MWTVTLLSLFFKVRSVLVGNAFDVVASSPQLEEQYYLQDSTYNGSY